MNKAALAYVGLRCVCGVAFVAICVWHGGVLAQDKEVAELEKQVNDVAKAVNRPAANEKDFRAAANRLSGLLAKTNKLIEESGDRGDEETPLTKLQGRILSLQKEVDERLPSQPSRRVANARTGFASPNFDERKLLAKLSEELSASQVACANQLRRSPDDPKANRDAITKLILAEERLAWEAGWPHIAKEAAAIEKSGGLTADVYVGRIQRGIERINKQTAFDYERVGRDPPHPFVLHYPEDEEHQTIVTRMLIKQRGEAAEAWTKIAKPFNEEHRKVLLSGQ